MNPLLNDDYENMVLNTNSNVTFNPLNFKRYNYTNPIMPVVEEEDNEHIEEFKPDIVSERIIINKKYFNSEEGSNVIHNMPIQLKEVLDNDFVEPIPLPEDVVEEVAVVEEIIEQTTTNIRYTLEKEDSSEEEPVAVEEPKPVVEEPPPPAKKKLSRAELIAKYKKKRQEKIEKEGLKQDVKVKGKPKTKKNVEPRKMLIDQRCKTNGKVNVKSGGYISFPIKNTGETPMYIYSMDLKVHITNSNVRATLYHTKTNPAKRKYVLDKEDWVQVDHPIRFMNYNSGVLNSKGAWVHIEIKELIVDPGDSYLIFKVDDKKYKGMFFLTGKNLTNIGNTLTYHSKVWTSNVGRDNTIYYALYGRQWEKRDNVAKQAPIKNSGRVHFCWKIKVTETKYYYFLLKSRYKCEIEIDGKEVTRSEGCIKGAKGSKKLEAGKTYKLDLTYLREDPDNYFAWTNKYNKNWIDDLSDTSVISFKLV